LSSSLIFGAKISHQYGNIPVYKTEINNCWGSVALTTRHPSIHKSWHYSPTSDGRSVGIIPLWTKSHG
jgi:hypothetical protein